MSELAWPRSPARPALERGVVDVWRADLAAAAAHGGERELLSANERERAARFVRAEDGRRWAAARGILRALLGACAGADPRALRFEQGPHGKPRLALDGDRGDAGGVAAQAAALRFNLSHSGDVALYAVALEREVGVDVELPRMTTDAAAIAQRVFDRAEAERIAGLPTDERGTAFLRAWVRWEAALKCRGTGIGAAGAPSDAPAAWIHELDVGAPAAAALAVESGPVSVRCWQWQPGIG